MVLIERKEKLSEKQIAALKSKSMAWYGLLVHDASDQHLDDLGVASLGRPVQGGELVVVPA